MSDLLTDDGLALHLRTWPVTNPRGSVVLVHGLGEHIGCYDALAGRLNAAGWAVAGHDQRGHGRSPGARGVLAGPHDLLRDLARVLDHVRAGAPGPLVLLGHSLGGAVAARFVAEGLGPEPAAWHRPVDALVLSSPALDLGMNALQQALLGVLGPLAPNLAVHNGLKPAWISRDPAVVRAYVDDPLVHDRVAPRLVRFLVDAGRIARERAAHWTVPTLLLWAGADRCVAPRGSAAFAAAAPRGLLRAREWRSLYHEVFNEPERDEVIGELLRWLAERGH